MPHFYTIVYFLVLQFICSYTKLDKTFKQSPTEVITLNKIQYLFYNYRVSWEEARLICLGYESQLATLDTIEKALFITKQTSESSLADEELWIGSKMHSKGFWIWISSNKKLLPNEFFQEMMTLPHYVNGSLESNIHCLTIFRKNHSIPLFSPLRCQEERSFICQRDELLVGANIENLFTIKIENKDFTLFSAKLTWLESVVQCRQRKLQIAEISTTTEAQLLAIKMIRTRPRSIENAWIGGYVKDRVWKWLPTGSNISRNQMWYDDNMISGDCLLLDRHICEFPMYVSTKCDRKRNFLCQTPVEKLVQSEPVAVFVDACQYWIGFHPKKWLDARQSCRKLNATLVVLDSITTMNHITNIMIDNRGKLQHIWLDGRKQQEATKEKVNDSTWRWESTGERIPSLKESFIPWYGDSRLYENNTDCLNMDRENFDVPIVYGLDCNTKQAYICQKKSNFCNQIQKTNIFNASYQSTENSNKKLLFDSKDESTISLNSESKPLDKKPNNLSKTANINAVSKNIFQHELDVENSTLSDNYTDNDLSISVRFLLDDFVDRKKLNHATNNQESTTIPILGFKDIIELMAKNVAANKNLSTILSSNTDRNKPKEVLVENVDRKFNNKVDKEMKIFLNDNISKIVQSSINKNIYNVNFMPNGTHTIPIAKTFSDRKLFNKTSHAKKEENNSRILQPQSSKLPVSSSKNDAPVKSVASQYRIVGSSEIQASNAKNTFILNEIMKNIFDSRDPSLKIDTFDTNGKEKHMTLKTLTSTTEKNIELYKIKTNAKKNNLAYGRKFSSKNTIQPIRKHSSKDKSRLNVSDVVNAVKHDFTKLDSKSLSLSIRSDMPLGIQRNYVKPWNALLQHVFQSLNNTKINVNNKTTSLHIKSYS